MQVVRHRLKLPPGFLYRLDGKIKKRPVVRLKFHLSVRCQYLLIPFQEFPAGQPSLCVAVLGPWVGKFR